MYDVPVHALLHPRHPRLCSNGRATFRVRRPSFGALRGTYGALEALGLRARPGVVRHGEAAARRTRLGGSGADGQGSLCGGGGGSKDGG